ncbi:hypothetical protein DENSPDRAFT_931108 [Dentipellis sp. KUC8613]|nr:hypothetical protein DENSPDRAFT_931108 [Dentipellis sp. KUC8613]
MASPASSLSDAALYIIAIFIPPIPVFIKRQCTADVFINILLWILGWIPGVLHSWYVIYKNPAVV